MAISISGPRIIVGVSCIDEIEPLAKAGAGEFYAGLYRRGEIPLANHRPGNPNFSFSSFQELKESVEICHSCGKMIFLTVNELAYAPGLYKKLIALMLKALGLGIDGFIIGDFYLLHELQRKLHAAGIVTRMHLSSLANCFDAMTVKFYKQFGIARVILPQQLYAREAASIMKDPGIETEAFYHKANDCINVDGRCHFCSYQVYLQKATGGYPCGSKFKILNRGKSKAPCALDSRWAMVSGINSYSNLYDFVKMGITAIKVGLRERSKFALKAALLKQLVREISLIRNSCDKAGFLREVNNAA